MVICLQVKASFQFSPILKYEMPMILVYCDKDIFGAGHHFWTKAILNLLLAALNSSFWRLWFLNKCCKAAGIFSCVCRWCIHGKLCCITSHSELCLHLSDTHLKQISYPNFPVVVLAMKTGQVEASPSQKINNESTGWFYMVHVHDI